MQWTWKLNERLQLSKFNGKKIFFTSDVAIWNWEGKNSIEKVTFSESRKGKEDEALSTTLIDYVFFILFEVKAIFKHFRYFLKMISQAYRILKGTFKVKHFPENSLLCEQCASKLKLIGTSDVNMLTEFVLREQISVLQMWNPEILQLTVSFHTRESLEHHQCVLSLLWKDCTSEEMSNSLPRAWLLL